MFNFLKVVKAEAIKKHKSQYHSISIYFSLLLWPILELFTAYFTYQPFLNLQGSSSLANWISEDKVTIFIIIGYVVFMFFNVLVDSAWGFSTERIHGTLDLIYLSPSNMYAVLLGNVVSSLFISIWMFLVFSVGALFIFTDLNIFHYYMIFIVVAVLVISSTCWGIFLNAIFLFARDTRLLYTIIKAPMDIFSGVKVPFNAFPFWAKFIGSVYPLTWSLNIIRKIFIDAAKIKDIFGELCIVLFMCILITCITIIILKKAEEYSLKTGNNTLF